jgi:hypothetical protein
MFPFALDAQSLTTLMGTISAALCGLVVLGGLGFAVMLMRREKVLRSCQFGAMLVVLPLLVPAIACALTATSALSAAPVASGVTTMGTVVDHEQIRGGTFKSVITFEDTAGTSYRITSPNSCRPVCDETGDQVAVRYNPANPNQATLDTGPGIWLSSVCFGAVTLIALGIGAVVAIRGYRSGNWWAVAEGLTDLAV